EFITYSLWLRHRSHRKHRPEHQVTNVFHQAACHHSRSGCGTTLVRPATPLIVVTAEMPCNVLANQTGNRPEAICCIVTGLRVTKILCVFACWAMRCAAMEGNCCTAWHNTSCRVSGQIKSAPVEASWTLPPSRSTTSSAGALRTILLNMAMSGHFTVGSLRGSVAAGIHRLVVCRAGGADLT